MQRLRSLHLESISSPTSLDEPRRITHPITGLASLTSLFLSVGAVLEEHTAVTIAYIHLPNSVIVEDRYGWEAHEAFMGMSANYLSSLAATLRKERGAAVLMHAFADDYCLIIPAGSDDDAQLEAALADGFLRHLAAMDKDLASVSKVYVGLESARAFSRIHDERLIYRGILRAARHAQDIGQRELMAQARVLDRALSQRAFNLVYQPIVGAESQSIYGYEALVRCPEPQLKSPLVLFDIAERSGRGRQLNRLLRRLAVDPIGELPENEHMFINLHVDDVSDPQMLNPPEAMLRNSSRIVLEVTERAAIKNMSVFKAKLAELRQMGFHIAIDDLGSGYSGLNTVADVEPDFIKFDMALIRDIDTSGVRQNLVKNLMAFADDLGVRAVAEGVETEAEYHCVRDLGCHLVQGYYFARPSPPFKRTLGD